RPGARAPDDGRGRALLPRPPRAVSGHQHPQPASGTAAVLPQARVCRRRHGSVRESEDLAACPFPPDDKEDRMTKTTVGIFIFDEVEVLDFAGPFEVFSRTRTVAGSDSRRTDDSAPFTVFTVARNHEPVTAVGGLRVIPAHAWDDAPAIDLLVIPGGFRTPAPLKDDSTLAWIRAAASRASQVTSVCTGALLLAQAGLLKGRRATTHWAGLDLLASIDPSIRVQRDVRVVHDGVFTSAGVSAGMDMAFAVVEQLCGKAVADETAHYIEYPRQRRSTSANLSL